MYQFLMDYSENCICSRDAEGVCSAESFSDIPASVLSRLSLTEENRSCKGSETESCQGSQSGITSKLLTENRGEERLMPSAEVSPAKASHQPEMEPDSTIRKADSGVNRRESLATYDPMSCSLKTHQCSLLEAGCESLRTLPRWGMIVGGELYPLPTPSGLLELRASITSVSASGFTGRLPTVTVCGNNNRKGASAKSGDGLATAVMRLSTPLANDGASHKRSKNSKLRGTPPLREQVQRLPTPNASDNRDRGNMNNPSVQRLTTPCQSDTGHRKKKYAQGGTATSTQVGGPLNPDWTEWFMGWPIGWSAVKPLETDKFLHWWNSHGKS